MTHETTDQELRRLWAGAPLALDGAALLARAQRSRRALTVRLALETAAGAAVLVFWGAVLATGPRAWIVEVLGYGSVAAVLVWWIAVLVAHREAFAGVAKTSQGLVALEHRRLIASLRWARLQLGGVLLVAAGIIVAMPWVWRAGEDVYRAEPWRLVLAGIGLVVVVAGTVRQTARRRRRYEAALLELGAMRAAHGAWSAGPDSDG
jgi:hypothetical protein